MDTFDLAKKALDSVDAHERDISTLTMSISAERFDEFREKIRQFRNELITMITADTAPSRVFQLNIALFPLSGPQEQP